MLSFIEWGNSPTCTASVSEPLSRVDVELYTGTQEGECDRTTSYSDQYFAFRLMPPCLSVGFL